MSQLELGSMAEVSPRHISFLESGRSNPSRPMVLHLADALEVPRSERNRLLGAAGFAPAYTSHDPDDPQMEPIRKAVEWTLTQHDPFPAIVLDRHWKVVDANTSANMMLAMLGVEPVASLLDVFLQDGGAADMIENWSEVGYFLLTRLRTESAALGGDDILDDAIRQLAADERIAPSSELSLPPVIPSVFVIDELRISMFSTIAQFGSAEDLTLADHRIELFFPADEPTREFFVSFAG